MHGSWRLRTWRGQGYELLESLASRRFRPRNYVIVNGFWRSGTTWVQEALARGLAAKPVFEPFESSNKPYTNYTKTRPLPRRDWAFVTTYFPFLATALDSDPALASLVRRAVGGGWYGMWRPLDPAYCDRTFADVMRKRVVTKFVRVNLCLGAIQGAIDVPIIHVYRDPRAVVASLIHPDPSWGRGAFLNFPLRAHLLEVDDGREEVFSKWRGEILEIDGMPNPFRLAAYHILTESYAMQTLAREPGRAAIIRYESLVTDGFAAIDAFLATRGLSLNHQAVDLGQPSMSNKRPPKGNAEARTNARLYGWREVLLTDTAEQISDFARTFDLASHCYS